MFGRKVDVLCRANDEELLALEARRKRNVVAAAALREDLLRCFGELEAVVDTGRREIVAEQERQQVGGGGEHWALGVGRGSLFAMVLWGEGQGGFPAVCTGTRVA